MLDLRDDINLALAGSPIQTVAIRGNVITLTTMDSVKATSLSSRVGTFLHLISVATNVSLDSPVTQILVHGIPTSSALSEIATELTTFNTGLALTGQPRWLTTEQSRMSQIVTWQGRFHMTNSY